MLFSKELVYALKGAGVENIQIFPIDITDKSIQKKYFAVNIIGLVECANLEHSEYTDIIGTGATAIAFRKLIIDEEKAKTKGLRFFRLSESVSSIVVHENIKKHLDKKGFKYLKYRLLT